MELADMPGHPARRIAHRHKAWVEQYLAEVLAEAGVEDAADHARELIVIIEGAMAMILIHGDPAYADAAASAARKLFDGEAPQPRALARAAGPEEEAVRT